jgi:Domain of unknown function (DUF6265)
MIMKRLALLLALAFPLAAAEPTLDDLAWIAGHWSEGNVEELWLAPKGGVMLGMSRTIRRNGTAAFEFIRIATTGDGIAYIAQPGGRPPTSFKLVESKPGRAVFTNPEHDFPKRIVYELREGKLCARTDDGKDGEEWCWARVAQ